MAERRIVVINRDRWLRNECSSRSRLLRTADGKMCCLGFYLGVCGVPKEDLEDISAPPDVRAAVLPDEASWLIKPGNFGNVNTDEASCLMHLNDEESDDDAGREEAIRKRFADHGVDVQFVDRAVPLASEGGGK